MQSYKKIAFVLFLISILFQSPWVRALESSEKIKVSPLLKTGNTWNGKAIAYPQGKAEITALLVEMAPGAETGWHIHPVPSFGMILEGELEVQLKSGEKKLIKAGDALAEVIDTAHNGRNVGDTPVKLVVFYAGVVGKELTIKQVFPQEKETKTQSQ